MATMVNRNWWTTVGDDVAQVRCIAQNLQAATCQIALPDGRIAWRAAYSLHHTQQEAEDERRRDNCPWCDGSGYITDYDDRWQCLRIASLLGAGRRMEPKPKRKRKPRRYDPAATDTTRTLRSARRVAGLNAKALAAGYDTWRMAETAVLNGRARIVRIED